MKEGILDKSDNIQNLNNKKFAIKTKIYTIILSLIFIGFLTTIALQIFNNKNIMNFYSNSNYLLLKEENDYSFVSEYITESEDQTIEIISPIFKNIISKLIIDGEQKELCTSYNFKSKGIHRIYVTLNLEGVTTFQNMFYNNKNLISIAFSPSLNTENITNFRYLFFHCENLKSVDLSHLNFRNADLLIYTFSFAKSLKTIDLSNIYAEKLIDMPGTFYGSESLTFINLTNFNAPNLVELTNTFHKCTSLISIDFSNFRAPKLMKLQYTFYQSTSLKSVNLSSIETDNLTTLVNTFYDCHSIESIYLPKITTKKEILLSTTFTNCYSLKSIDLSNYSGRYLSVPVFRGCTNLSYIDISSYDSIPDYFFSVLPKTGQIKLNKKTYNNIKDQIPEDWTVILIK